TFALGDELRCVNAMAVNSGLANLDPNGALPRFAFLCHAQFWNRILTSGCCVILFFNGSAYFTQVFPEGVTRIGDALFQVSREGQLFTQRAAVLDRLRLTPFSFPNFVCD